MSKKQLRGQALNPIPIVDIPTHNLRNVRVDVFVLDEDTKLRLGGALAKSGVPLHVTSSSLMFCNVRFAKQQPERTGNFKLGITIGGETLYSDTFNEISK